MKIYTKLEYLWNASGQIIIDSFESFEYNGPIASCCGSTGAQNSIQQQQSQFSQQLTQQASQVFGNSSQVFQDLTNSFAPTVAAGPNQKGFSAAENANLQSQAITQTGQAYKNAKAALGDAQSSVGGGNTSLTGGATIGENANLASSAANQTAGELSNINLADYQQGTQNYDTAVSGLEKAPNVFGTSTGAANAASSAQAGAANTANQIATQSNSWVNAVAGMAGQIGGAAVGDFSNGAGASVPTLDTSGGMGITGGIDYGPPPVNLTGLSGT